ncbi:MAG: hypothetical protein JJE18_01800 [Eubacteriaceae bacterium]|nr:hypothetical protein [Eubacteriaceae bacterium]
MKKNILNVVEEEVVDLDVLSQGIRNNEYQGFYEMQNEDFTLSDYSNPFENMRDLSMDSRGSIRYSY